MQITTVGLDLVKRIFQVYAVAASGDVVVRKARAVCGHQHLVEQPDVARSRDPPDDRFPARRPRAEEALFS